MKQFSVEVIVDRNEQGASRDFRSHSLAKKYAVKESLKPGVLETFLSGQDEDDAYFEVMEYYAKGTLSNKVS